MTIILLLRHGNTAYNHERRYQGRLDIPLDDQGRQEAQHVVPYLARESLAAIYSSPLSRAQETATIIAQGLPHAMSVQSLPDLTEIDLGHWSGLTAEEAKARYPDEYAVFEADKNAPRGGGESRQEVQDRTASAILRIAQMYPDQTVLVVTHEAVIKTLAGWAMHLPIQFQPNLHGVVNVSRTYIEVDPVHKRTRLAAYNLPLDAVSPLGAEMSES